MSILTLGSKKKERRKISNQRVGESKKKRKKIPNQRMGESKKGRRRRKESSWSRIERKQKKCAERSFDQTISEQYRIVTKWTNGRKGNHDLKWSSPFNCQPKSCVLATFLPGTKPKQKRKKPKKSKAKKPTKRTRFQGKSYWSMITHVIFDLIGNDL